MGVCDEELGDAGRADLRPLHLHLFFLGCVWCGMVVVVCYNMT